MNICRDAYDQKPFFIRQGALQLWGTLLAKRVDLCQVRELYSFSGFFAELCYDQVTGTPTCICSFNRSQRMEPYLDELSLAELIIDL